MTWDPSCLSNLKDKNFKIDEEDEKDFFNAK